MITDFQSDSLWHDDTGSSWIKIAYGDEAARHLSELSLVEDQIDHAIADFYTRLNNISHAQEVLGNLSPAEAQHLVVAQKRYLCRILAPNLSAETHYHIAIEAGLRHVAVGLSIETLTEAMWLYKDITTTLTKDRFDAAPLRFIIETRLQYDLLTQIKAYADARTERLKVYEHIERQQAANPQGFLRGVAQILKENMREKVAGVAVGSISRDGYQHIIADGMPWQDMDHAIQAPAFERAWAQENPLFINNLHHDDRLPVDFREECRDLGIRSIGVLVIRDALGRPIHLLLVGMRYPGYFLHEDARAFWQRVADHVGGFLDGIVRTGLPTARRLTDGPRFRQLLAQGKVEMHYQPIVDVKTGRTVKVEALVRLRDGDEIISPARFLPAFGTHQLNDLFYAGLEKVRDDLSDLDLICSINMPTEFMADRRQFSQLPALLDTMDLPPRRIALEILESPLAMQNEVMRVLSTLREMQYEILLDDVGAGESSLLRLSTLPISGIKIDQGLVRPLQYGFDNLDVILSLQGIALQRGLNCVVEGVETPSIVDMLASAGKVLQQGYAFAKPMPVSELREWLARAGEGIPLGSFPQSLYGWFSAHMARTFHLSAALFTIHDLIDIDTIADAECCALHGIIHEVGGDEEVVSAHYAWHAEFAKMAKMAKTDRTDSSKRAFLETLTTRKATLRALIERKLRTKDRR
jgi:EAL domain-containing protein (putative c-di-GMP-specific phosphodiesterase class I)